jgi:hypothetical protein
MTFTQASIGAIPPRPRRRGDQPIQIDTTPVPLRGEPLDKVLWRGKQWAVTAYGLERLNGTYNIAADQLLDGLNEYGGFPMHVCLKTWVDTDDFLTAWLVALALHGRRASKEDILAAIAKCAPSRSGQDKAAPEMKGRTHD